MKAHVYSLSGEKKGEISLGKAFSTPLRADLIRRAFLAECSARRQPYGADPLAGKRTSAHYHGKRHYRYSMMNREMARMKRIHNQGFLNLTARFVPQAIKGRKAHPPKTEKNWKQSINRKEKLLAMFSAMAASSPIVIEDKFQELSKTKDVVALLKKLGVGVREKKTVRAGRGKARGRKHRKKKGPLIILSSGKVPRPPGADVVQLKDVSVTDLAPGGNPGRVCIWTESSIKGVEEM